MKKFVSGQLGRLLFLHLGKGDDVLKSICRLIEEEGVKSGMVASAVGSLSKARFHYIGSLADDPDDVFQTVEAPLELASLQGLILGGKPHLHAVFSSKEKTYAGHLEEGCEVQYLAEICILEVEGLPLTRKPDEHGVLHMSRADKN